MSIVNNFMRRETLEAGCYKTNPYNSAFLHRIGVGHIFRGHHGCVNTVQFANDARTIISGSDDCNINLSDSETKKNKLSYASGHTGNIFCARNLPHRNEIIVSCARDGDVRVHDIVAKRTTLFGSHDDNSSNRIATIESDPNVFISVGSDSQVIQFDFRVGSMVKAVSIPEISRRLGGRVASMPLEVHSIAMEGDGNHFIIGCRDPFIRRYDRRMLESSKITNLYCPRDMASRRCLVTGVALSHDDREVLGTYNDAYVWLFDVEEQGLPVEERRSTEFVTLAPLCTPSAIMDAFNDHQIQRPKQVYKGHRNCDTIKQVSFFGSESSHVISGSDCGHLFFWEKATGDCAHVVKGDRYGAVNCITPHPLGLPALITSGLENTFKLWEPVSDRADASRLVVSPEAWEQVMLENQYHTSESAMDDWDHLRVMRDVGVRSDQDILGEWEEDARLRGPPLNSGVMWNGEDDDGEDDGDEDDEEGDGMSDSGSARQARFTRVLERLANMLYGGSRGYHGDHEDEDSDADLDIFDD